MKIKFLKVKNYILDNTSKFLSCYKICLLVFFIIFLIGFITGIMTCSHYSKSITYENIINEYLLKFLACEYKFTTYSLILSIWFILISLFVIFFTRNLLMVVVNGVFLALMSYIYGFDLCVIIISFGLAGVVLGILVLGILGVILFLLFMLVLSVATKRFWINKKFCESVSQGYYFKIYLFIICLSIAIIFIMSMMFSVIHIFIIVD